ncbi:MAG: DNA primase [Treponema sp.]|nr:DNA primase [Treponema sp.]
MKRISKTTIQEVIDRLDAVAVINDYVRLEKRSGRWWGRCPFHGGGQERTPSFKVEPDLKTYYCFGCNKGDTVIGFIMEMDKLSYPEAIKTLARKYGIQIVNDDGGEADETNNTRIEELLELYRRTSTTFQFFLKKKPDGSAAFQYILGRGISEEMVERFRLGYAPSDRDFLYKFLMGKGYSEDFLDKSGLFSSRYKGMSLFSGRLMFPITDRQGRVVAFGGRALPGILQSDGKEPPKYINSPELETYKKGQTLFALDLALPEIRQSKTVYIVEGYMDVIALHQAGIKNTVAPLGTAFTDEQAKLLKRWAEKAVLIFDSDEAGQKAALKAIITCRKNGLTSALFHAREAANAVLLSNEGEKAENIHIQADQLKDPADILQKYGHEILYKTLKYCINDFEYLISRGKFLYDVSVPEGKNKAFALLFPYLEVLDSEIERDDCINSAADAFGVDRDAVVKDLRRHSGNKKSRLEVRENSADDTADRLIRMNSELFTLIVVSVNMRLYPEFRKALEIKDIEDPAAKELFIALEECYINDETSIDDLLARIGSQSLRNLIISRGTTAEFEGGNSGDPEKLLEDGIKGIKKKKLRRRLVEIGRMLRESERSVDSENQDTDELLAEKMFVDSQIRLFEGR